MGRLSHIDDKGEARMVDVSDKASTARRAVAEGFLTMQPETLALVEAGTGTTDGGGVTGPAAARWPVSSARPASTGSGASIEAGTP